MNFAQIVIVEQDFKRAQTAIKSLNAAFAGCDEVPLIHCVANDAEAYALAQVNPRSIVLPGLDAVHGFVDLSLAGQIHELRSALGSIASVTQDSESTRRDVAAIRISVDGDGNGRKGIIRRLDKLEYHAAIATWVAGGVGVAVIGGIVALWFKMV